MHVDKLLKRFAAILGENTEPYHQLSRCIDKKREPANRLGLDRVNFDDAYVTGPVVVALLSLLDAGQISVQETSDCFEALERNATHEPWVEERIGELRRQWSAGKKLFASSAAGAPVETGHTTKSAIDLDALRRNLLDSQQLPEPAAQELLQAALLAAGPWAVRSYQAGLALGLAPATPVCRAVWKTNFLLRRNGLLHPSTELVWQTALEASLVPIAKTGSASQSDQRSSRDAQTALSRGQAVHEAIEQLLRPGPQELLVALAALPSTRPDMSVLYERWNPALGRWEYRYRCNDEWKPSPVHKPAPPATPEESPKGLHGTRPKVLFLDDVIDSCSEASDSINDYLDQDLVARLQGDPSDAPKSERDPNGIDAHSPGAKLDAGKNRCALVIGGFSAALWEVSRVGTFGAAKYTPNGWKEVENGVERYADAMQRHLLLEAQGEDIDRDSNLLHAAHAAWNALARLELILREKAGDA
jgi:hypothetical protein